MKFVIAIIASSIYVADASLSTMRVGPRHLTRVEKRVEFGREVDIGDVDAAFAELNAAHIRLLQDPSFLNSMSYAGMSMSSSGMTRRRLTEVREDDDDGFKHLMDDAAHNEDVVISVERREIADVEVPIGLTTTATAGGSNESSMESFDFVLVVLVLAMMVVVIYCQKRATRERRNDKDWSVHNSSSILGVDTSREETMGTSVELLW